MAQRRRGMKARPARMDRDLRPALWLAGCVVGLAGAASTARWIGVTEAMAGGVLAVACAAVFGAVVAVRLRSAGTRSTRVLAWTIALVVAAAAPVLVAVFPGRLVAEGTLSRAGDAVHLGPGLHGAVRVLVSGALPEASRLGFSLRLGPGILEGTLRRGATWWRAGEERRHYHEDRRSVLLGGDIPSGVDAVVLERLVGNGVPLTVHVYAQGPPRWLVTIFSIGTGLSFLFLHGRVRRTRFPAAVAAVAVSSGVLGSMIARPDFAVGPVLAGVVAGTLVGVPVARVVSDAARALEASQLWKRLARGRGS